MRANISDLIIELERVSLSPEFLSVLRQELEAGGIDIGRFAVGDVTAAPDSVYFLWHDSGEAPVSMVVERAKLEDEEGSRLAARDFLVKWRKRYQ